MSAVLAAYLAVQLGALTAAGLLAKRYGRTVRKP